MKNQNRLGTLQKYFAKRENCGGFDAADMASNSANGFREGAKELERVTSEIELMVNSLASGEWAEHAGETELGSRLELEITKLVGLATSLKAERDAALAEVEQLREALEEIVSPIRFMQARLEDGYQLNGMAAIQMANDPEYLRNIAKQALSDHFRDAAKMVKPECGCRVESDEKFGSLIYTCPQHDNSAAGQQAEVKL